MIRVITYNVHFGKRIAKILIWLAGQKQADVVCLQEFPEHRIADCVDALGNKKYGYGFAPAIRLRKKIYGQLTLYRSGRVRFMSSSVLLLGTNRLEKIALGRLSVRSGLITAFEVRKKPFILANVHLINLATNRRRFAQVRAVADALPQADAPNIILGDFNVSSLLGRKKLIALMKKHRYHTIEKRMATHRFAILKHQIDYVFGKNCRIQEMTAERVRFSDHYPIHAHILFTK